MLLAFVVYYLFFVEKLPKGYSLYTDDKYWHTSLLDETRKVIVPPTVIDYVVNQDYIFLLRLSGKYRFSKKGCNQCLSGKSNCNKYWVYNWKKESDIGSMNSQELTKFVDNANLKYPKLKYDTKKGASYICNTL